MSRGRILRCLLTLFLLTVGTATRAQWQRVHVFGSAVSSVKFLGDIGMPNIGFVGAGSYVYRTSDGGVTWNQVLNTPGASASAFCFRNGLVGWCSVYGRLSGNAGYVTFDGGKSWRALAPIGEGCDVYYNLANGLVFLSLRTGAVYVSSNDGNSWSINNAGMNGFAFTTGSSGICSTVSATFASTSDGGQTWSNNISGIHCWSPVAAPNMAGRYFAPYDQANVIFRSDNGGTSWAPSGNIIGALTGCAQATNCAVYVQSDGGVYVSTNLTSWRMLGGPGNDYDTRFSVSSSDLWAGDMAGGLWRTNASVTPWPTLDFYSSTRSITLAPGCRADTIPELFRNLTCTPVTVLSVTLSDSSVWRVVPKRLPVTLSSSDSLEITLTGLPKGSGVFTATLHLRLQNEVGTTDTTLTVTLDASRFAPPIIDSIRMSAVQCEPHDTVLHIVNEHCDSLRITECSSMDSALLYANGIVLPLTIPPDTSIDIPLTVNARVSGSLRGRMKLRFTYGSLALDTIVNVSVTVRDAYPSVTFNHNAIEFDTLTPCDDRDRIIYIHNNGCSVLEMTEFILSGDPSYQPVGVSLPLVIGVGDSLAVHVRLRPDQVGTPKGTLGIMLLNGVVERYYELPLTATVVNAKHGLSFAPSALAVDSVTPCSAYDTTIVIRNTSACDSMVIESISAPDPSVAITVGEPLPITLRDHDSIVVTLRVKQSSSVVTTNVHVLGPDYDSLIAVHVSFRSPVADPLSVTANETSFTLHHCDLDTSTVWLAALGCDDLVVDSLAFDEAGPFAVAGVTPLTIATSTALPIVVTIDGTYEAGTYQRSLTVRTRTGETRYLAMTATILPIDTTQLAVRLSPAAAPSPSAGSSTQTQVYFVRGAPATAMLTDLKFELDFDRDVLGETAITPASGWSVTRLAESPGSLTLRATRATAVPIADGDILLTVDHKAAVSKSLSTTVGLSHVVLMPDDPRYVECTLAASVDSAGIQVPISYTCPDSTLARFLSGRPILSDIKVAPNPARNDEIRVSVSANEVAACHFRLIDASGRAVVESDVQLEAGCNSLLIPIAGLPSGAYTLSLTAGGSVRSIGVSVVR